MMRWGRPRRDDERGAIIVVSTVGVVLAVISTALAVDLGRLAVTKRSDQKTADLAALDAARALPSASAAKTAAEQSATRNGLNWTSSAFAMSGADPDGLYVCLGTMVGGSFSKSADCQTGTVVRVQAQSKFSAVFPFVAGPSGVSASGAAGRSSPFGTVRVGSNLVTLDPTQRTVVNRLLTNVLGGTVNVNAVGWDGIVNGNVSFSRLRTALGYSAGSPDSVLDASITYRQLLDATATALQADGSPSSLAARAGILQFVSQVGASFGTSMKLRQLFDIVGNVGDGTDVADASFRVMDIVQGGAILADGDHFASATLLATDSLPSLGLIPNFYSAKLNFGLIEAPRLKSGSPGK
ncbi:MAG TPA: pilus assembly protein TadG-related protein, partial [Acidimicrobiales bacterium]